MSDKFYDTITAVFVFTIAFLAVLNRFVAGITVPATIVLIILALTGAITWTPVIIVGIIAAVSFTIATAIILFARAITKSGDNADAKLNLK